MEEAHDEIIGTVSFIREETNKNHLDGKHNVGSNADGPRVVGTPSQPPPTVSAAQLWLKHSIAYGDLVQDKGIFFSNDLEPGRKNPGIIELSVVACDKSGSIIGEFNEHVKPSKTTCITEESS